MFLFILQTKYFVGIFLFILFLFAIFWNNDGLKK